MVLFPEVQTRAQEEIDGVIGTNRLPAMEDQPNLPYINRVIQELFRWCPILASGKRCLNDYPYFCQRVLCVHRCTTYVLQGRCISRLSYSQRGDCVRGVQSSLLGGMTD